MRLLKGLSGIPMGVFVGCVLVLFGLLVVVTYPIACFLENTWGWEFEKIEEL